MTNQSTKGGARSGAGRKPGAPNKKTKEVQAAVAASGVTPLDYMLALMRDITAEPAARLDAAKSAAPYVHAKLASIELNANVTAHEASLDDLA
jgi:hypothetical protein